MPLVGEGVTMLDPTCPDCGRPLEWSHHGEARTLAAVRCNGCRWGGHIIRVDATDVAVYAPNEFVEAVLDRERLQRELTDALTLLHRSSGGTLGAPEWVAEWTRPVLSDPATAALLAVQAMERGARFSAPPGSWAWLVPSSDPRNGWHLCPTLGEAAARALLALAQPTTKETP
jgi:hypothetical protein